MSFPFVVHCTLMSINHFRFCHLSGPIVLYQQNVCPMYWLESVDLVESCGGSNSSISAIPVFNVLVEVCGPV